MSDELLRHLATNCGDLSRIVVFDEKTKKRKKALNGQAHRLLSVMCNYANTERICFVGRETLMSEARLNGQSIKTATDNLISAEILNYLGKTSYFGSIPVNTYLIDFPGLQPLEDALTEKELKKKARSLKALKSASKTPLESDLSHDSLGVSSTALKPALRARHKQELEHKPEYECEPEPEEPLFYNDQNPSEDDLAEFDKMRGYEG
jgi:hypothetical protein